MPTIERTHNFAREVPIDCENWLEFTVLESTYRYWRIRYTEEVDKTDANSVECDAVDKPALTQSE